MEQNMIKKTAGILTAFCMTVFMMAMLLSGCSRAGGGKTSGQDTPKTDGRISVVTTLFPYYDFTRQVAGDLVDLTMVVPAGMDSHSFEPTPADMLTIQNADVLISNGGAMEHWLDQVLDAVDTGDMVVMTGMDHVNAVEEILVEGMEEEHGHSHEGEDGEHAQEDHIHGGIGDEQDDGHEYVIEYDEHIWTSPVNAARLVEAIRDTLSEADPGHRDAYEANASAYLEKLSGLDSEFRDIVEHGKRRMIIVGDKFAFRYFADEYGLSYRAAFSGCSTDTEPSAQTIAYLIDKMRADEIPVIYYPELSSHRVAEIISEETGAVPLLLHSCHNVTRKEFDGGVTYLGLMEQNAENLRKGLN